MDSARALIARGWGVSLVSRCLRVSRAQLHVILRRTDDWMDGRRSRHTDDTDVLLRIHHVIGELPTYGYRRVTCLTDNQEPSPCLIWLPAPDITATFPECFSQLILAIRQCIHISLMTERWYPSLEPCRLIYYSGSWYLIALQKGKLQVFPLADIKSVSLTSERFERRGHIHSLVAEERFISALPHFSFIHKLINTFNL